jgi:cytochrome c oxidase subunit IV
MTDHAAAAHAAADHHEVNYMAKFWWLVGLTLAEVAVAVFVPGGFKLAGLAFFACWKASIVMNYFMHLKHENTALKLVVAFPGALVVVLVTLFLMDGHFLERSL